MKKFNLDHAFTPISLKELNAQVSELFLHESFDEFELLKLIEQRDAIINQYLQSCEPELQREFAKAELEVNGLLVAYVLELSKASLKQLSDLVRGRKAVKKYR